MYGDTDSLFIELPGRSLEEAHRIGKDMANTISRMCPPDVVLKFEKVVVAVVAAVVVVVAAAAAAAAAAVPALFGVFMGWRCCGGYSRRRTGGERGKRRFRSEVTRGQTSTSLPRCWTFPIVCRAYPA